jgi:putative membrane protein
MITYNPKDWLKLIFQFHKSDTFRVLFPAMILVAIYTGLLVFVENCYLNFHMKNPTIVHSILGFVLSMLLVFRINSAYDRWWEGRKLWGGFVNNSRNLAFKLCAFIPAEKKELRLRFRVLITNYIFVTKEHLRDNYDPAELEECDVLAESELAKINHKPNRIAGQLMKEAEKLHAEQLISVEQFLIMNEELKSFTEITGACERVKNTPIPYAYSLFLKKIIFIYVFTMPVFFAQDFGYWTIPVTLFIFYAFASLELISEEIEDPFGQDDNDLPTGEIAKRIKDNLLEIF